MELLLSGGKKITIQSVETLGSIVNIKIISTTYEELKQLFKEEHISEIHVTDDIEEKVLLGYTQVNFVKENLGGIWEVELAQKDTDPIKKISETEENLKKLESTIQQALAELTMMVSSLLEGGV